MLLCISRQKQLARKTRRARTSRLRSERQTWDVRRHVPGAFGRLRLQSHVPAVLLADDFVQFIANLLHTKRENGDEPRRCTVYGMGNGVTALAMSLDQLNKLLAIIREVGYSSNL